ncbi:MAG: lysophospholipid acyltransferase family protein [Planctomycetota bacterium]
MLHRTWYLFAQWICQVGCSLAFGLRVVGRRNIPATGSVLIVSNHQSFLDPVLVGVGLSREVHHLARETLFKNRLFRGLIVSLNAVAVRRGEADVEGVRRAIRVLKNGKMLLIFPEGTRTRDGGLQRIRPGWTALAARSGATVVPAVIEGAHSAWPRTRQFPRCRRIAVAFGEGFRVEERGRGEARRASERLESEWRRLRENLRKLLETR